MTGKEEIDYSPVIQTETVYDKMYDKVVEGISTATHKSKHKLNNSISSLADIFQPANTNTMPTSHHHRRHRNSTGSSSTCSSKSFNEKSDLLGNQSHLKST